MRQRRRLVIMMMMMMTMTLMAAAGCSNEASPSGVDASVDGGGVLDASADATVDTGTDAAVDAGQQDTDATEPTDAADAGADADAADTSPPPAACAAASACDQLLDANGLCAGTCMPQPQAPHCPRTPLHGLCHPTAAPEPTNVTATMGDIIIEPLQVPASAKTGEYHVVRLRLRRPGPGSVEVTLGAKAGKHWSLIATSFNLGANVTLSDIPLNVDLTLKATGWDLLDHAHEVAQLLVNGKGVPVVSVLTYAGEDAVACGGFSFPPSAPEYGQGRCCDGVFYPSAACCVDSDCVQGICADGRCMTRAPQSRIGRAMALGNLRVLWVVANAAGVGTPAICDDETQALRTTLGLPQIEGIFAAALAGRLGPTPSITAPLQFNWTVRAGLQIGVNINETKDLPYPELRDKVGQAMAAAGCKGVDFTDFDIVVLSHPKVYLEGFVGHVYANGWVGMQRIDAPRLTAHELMHTFGAGDLYTDVGGKLQWDHALMSTNTSGDKPLSDDVAWAEIGLADVDRNGVIDLVERASLPDGLVLQSVHAHIDKGPTLYLTVDLRASEAGVVRKLYFDAEAFDLSLVGTAAHSKLDDYKVQAQFDGPVLDTIGAKIGGSVKVRIKGSHTFTGAGFKRQTLSLDETLTVSITGP